jgi:hypothetical protein
LAAYLDIPIKSQRIGISLNGSSSSLQAAEDIEEYPYEILMASDQNGDTEMKEGAD